MRRFGRSREAREPGGPGAPAAPPRHPGVVALDDGSGAVVGVETDASEAAAAHPIPPSTRMADGFAAAAAAGRANAFGRRPLFFEPESAEAAAAVTTGTSLAGLRSTAFTSGQGVADMHESLFAAVGKRLTFVLHVACRAIAKHAVGVDTGHDDYHAVDDTGLFQLFAKDVQAAADLALVAHRIAELSLCPGLCAQDGFATSHTLETFRRPERELIEAYLGDPADRIESPTPAQRMVFGETRRRIPELFDVDQPATLGAVQGARSHPQGVAAQRPFWFDHVAGLADRAFAEYAELTGRVHARASGHRLDDADWVLVGQGSVVAHAEAVADHLRETRGIAVGVLNLAMLRPFPSDLVTRLLRGKRAVTVLERADQPLAADLPLLREIRTALARGVENHRALAAARRGERPRLPHAGVEPCAPDDVPELHSGCFGMGSRDLAPGDVAAAVENMRAPLGGRHRFYLGIDFVRERTALPKLEIWQERVQAAYPGVAELALPRVADADATDVTPEGGVALRVHALAGREGVGATALGMDVATVAAAAFGLHVKAGPTAEIARPGQPATFDAVLATEPVRGPCAPERVDVVLCPDADVFLRADPLAGLVRGGAIVLGADGEDDGADVLAALPARARLALREREIAAYRIDLPTEGAPADRNARTRARTATLLGAFFGAALPTVFRAAHPGVATDADGEELLARIRGALEEERGAELAPDERDALARGWRTVRRVATDAPVEADEEPEAPPALPGRLDEAAGRSGVADAGRFFEEVGSVLAAGEDPLADPFTALGAMPAATSALHDLTPSRVTVPEFVPENCTGCAKCWTQCPDAAIPGVVSTVEELLRAAIERAKRPDRPMNRLGGIAKHVAREAHKLLGGMPFRGIGDVLSLAYANVLERLAPTPARRAELDAEWAPVHSALADFPVARTTRFFDLPERAQKGSGGLLSVTVDPQACKGCDVCVAVCPDDALRTVRQTDDVVERLRANWALWQELPETDDRYVAPALAGPDPDDALAALPLLLLKQRTYQSTVGGDVACRGCGEKTDVHLVLSAVNALLLPRVDAHVRTLEELLEGIDAKARALVAEDADLEAVARAADGGADVHVSGARRDELARLLDLSRRLRDQHWRYTTGPSGRGRARAGFANSTGCSAVWGASYPYNPYPFPWTHHLYQDAPSLAIGLFEGHMRKMADGFRDVRRARLELAGDYDADVHEPELAALDWRGFTDDELALCPPLFAVGGDGAMGDAGLQSLSRLLASDLPIRVVVLDTQAQSSTGGLGCTSAFAPHAEGPAMADRQPDAATGRKELALLAIAHRNAFVLQSSQAAPAHLLGGVLAGLRARRPAIFVLSSPCPRVWGISGASAPDAAKLALESRAVPLLVYDPERGPELADRLDLGGNPELDADWPTYELVTRTDSGEESTLTLPVTIADWAAHEERFRRYFHPLAADADADGASAAEPLPFHEYLALPPAERKGRTPFLHTKDADGRLGRLGVGPEIVALADERLAFWNALRELAGVVPSSAARRAARAEAERGVATEAGTLRGEPVQPGAGDPRALARRLAEGLLRAGPDATIGQLLEQAGVLPAAPAAPPPAPAPGVARTGAPARLAAAPAPPAASEAAHGDAPDEPDADDLAIEPTIDTALCTSCDDCIKLNGRMFAYDDNKQAYIRDPRAGTFRELVTAAEKCPAGIIHPGTPLDPSEKGLDDLVARAERFN